MSHPNALLRLSSDHSSLYSLNQGIEIAVLPDRGNSAGFVPCLCQEIEKPWICLVAPVLRNYPMPQPTSLYEDHL
jgi:hypothetical protein